MISIKLRGNRKKIYSKIKEIKTLIESYQICLCLEVLRWATSRSAQPSLNRVTPFKGASHIQLTLLVTEDLQTIAVA